MKKLYLFIIYSSINFLLLTSIHAASLDKLLSYTARMQAEFTQKIYDNKNKVIQVSYGKFVLDRPGKLRWEIEQPNPQLIIINNNKIWVYDPDLAQVTIKPLQAAPDSVPAILLSQVHDQLEKHFIIQAQKTMQNDLQWFTLKPKNNDPMFLEIKLGFNGNILTQMDLKDNLGHKTNIHYKKIKVNQTISSTQFQLKVPAHVEVIDEQKQN